MEGTGECKCFKSTGHNEHSEQLFPRLPNEITFSRIVPRLAWTAFHVLAAVSRTWRKAIRDHRVHDARMHSSSTNTLVVHGHSYDFRAYKLDGAIRSARIAVYSVTDKLCYDLPPVPGYKRGVPWSCECVSHDGRIYVLGGADEYDGFRDKEIYPSTSKVYVLDLAAASHWIECASMERARKKFGCAVLDGKIYVFGGTSNDAPVRGAEVYDPKVNAWSPIAPMADLRYGHEVSTLAQEIFVYGGSFYHPSYLHWKANGGEDSTLQRSPLSFIRSATHAEVYNPVKDEWRVDNSVRRLNIKSLAGKLFSVQGKLHAIRKNDISVCENEGSWTHLKGHEFPNSAIDFFIHKIVEVGSSNELLAGVYWCYEDDQEGVNGLLTVRAICQSKGFGTEDNTMVWNVISKCPGYHNFMHCIQL